MVVAAVVAVAVEEEAEEVAVVEVVLLKNPLKSTYTSGTTNLSTYVDAAGVFSQQVSVSSSDNICSVDIPAGTTGKTAEGSALNYISLVVIPSNQGEFTPGSGVSHIGPVYWSRAGGCDL